MENSKAKNKKVSASKSKRENSGAGGLSYRLKCAKTANGLSHFVMYGDVPKGKTLL